MERLKNVTTKLYTPEHEWAVHAEDKTTGTRWVDTLNHCQRKLCVSQVASRVDEIHEIDL